MPVERCVTCNESLGVQQQGNLFNAKQQCVQCQTNARAKMMLAVLPHELGLAWDELSDYEQEFLPSVRRQFEQKRTLTEKQYQIVERMYEKYN